MTGAQILTALMVVIALVVLGAAIAILLYGMVLFGAGWRA